MRADARERKIVISNPDMTRHLPNHPKWIRFFSNLSYIVVMKCTYRGFGSHMANVKTRIRRRALLRIDPVFIFCSATIGNPQELAEQLAGKICNS